MNRAHASGFSTRAISVASLVWRTRRCGSCDRPQHNMFVRYIADVSDDHKYFLDQAQPSLHESTGNDAGSVATRQNTAKQQFCLEWHV